jgi:hypothetical protein
MTEATNIGEAFAAHLKMELSSDGMAEVRALNATPAYADCCASHDFLDANEVMLTAFQDIMGRDAAFLDGEGAEADADEALWNAAWDYARAKHLVA